jgi:hypothetical protein
VPPFVIREVQKNDDDGRRLSLDRRESWSMNDAKLPNPDWDEADAALIWPRWVYQRWL